VIPELMTWPEFLGWLMGAGLNTAVGFVLSFLADYVPWYNKLEPKWSRLVFILSCFVIPIGATVAAIATGAIDGAWLDWAGVWWPAIMAGGMAAFAGTVAHTRLLTSK